MNKSARLNAVLELLAEHREVEVDDIALRLGASAATIRRDLDTLAQQQLLTRTHGGAIGQSVAYDLPIRFKKHQNAAAKQVIAELASSLISPGCVLGLTGGTTAAAIASTLMRRADIMEPAPQANLTVVTTAINIAAQLATRSQIKTVVTGGVINTRSYELVGSYADAVLANVTLDIALIGVNTFDALVGPCFYDEREAAVNKLMAQRATRAMVVADSSKLGRRAFATVGGADLFPTVITDSGISAEQHRDLIDQGYEVLTAQLG